MGEGGEARPATAECLCNMGTELGPIAAHGGRLVCRRARLERGLLGQVHEHDARHERHALAVAHLRGRAMA
jgi:hypothetical protein